MRKKSWSLSKKLYAPNIIYLLLLIGALFMYFSTTSMIRNLEEDQSNLEGVVDRVGSFGSSIKAYMDGDLPIGKLRTQAEDLAKFTAQGSLEGRVAVMREKIEALEKLNQANLGAEKEITGLAQSSTKESNQYIGMVAKKLADEKTREEVSTLERMVIIGANTNTVSNYEVLIRFLRLKENLGSKDELLFFIDQLITNTAKDVKALADTPFAQMALTAQKVNHQIKSLTEKFIANTQAQTTLQAELIQEIKVLNEKINERARLEMTNVFGVLEMALLILILVLGGGILLGIIINFLMARSITKPINRIIDGLNAGSDQVATASSQVSSTSQSLAEGASEQAASLEETTSSMEEMSSMTRANSENSAQADSLMVEAKEIVTRAGGAMKEMGESMGHIADAGSEIGKIVKSIDEIAFQTNLLALNAAVEAARAGEAGAGFAVVADEVRNLAMRAAEAAKSTQTLVEGTVDRIGQGSQLVTQTQDGFEEIAESAGKVAGLVSEIAAASSEQSQGIDQVGKAMVQMDEVTQRVAANAEESASASEELSAQAQTMKEMVIELTAIVSGVRAIGSAEPEIKAAGTSDFRPALSKSGKEVRPERVIPFGDDGLEDF